MKVGILGGTFDPVHSGHLYIANKIREILDLDRVLFMVAKQPPHKGSRCVSQLSHRYAMVVLALLDERDFLASSMELLRKGPSYTIETLQQLRDDYPGDQFCFIGGSDSLKELHLWKDCDKLLWEHCLVFVQRPGAEVSLDGLEIAPESGRRAIAVSEGDSPHIIPGRTYLVSLNAPPVSSTEIRRLVASGGRPSHEHVPERVLDYIEKYQLYHEHN